MNRHLLDDSIRQINYDNSIIQGSINMTNNTIANLNSQETEVLNVTGQGIVQGVWVYAPTGTTMIKLYIDDDLFFNFGTVGKDVIGLNFGKINIDLVTNFSSFVDGNIATISRSVAPILKFKKSLKVLSYSTINDGDHKVSIQYGLVG